MVIRVLMKSTSVLMFLSCSLSLSLSCSLLCAAMTVKKTQVFEGESVFLSTGFTELKSDDVIQLSFGDKVIAEFNKDDKTSSEERQSRDQLR